MTSSIQQAAVAHDHGLNLVTAHTTHVTYAVAPQSFSASVLQSGPTVAQDEPVTPTPDRLPSPRVSVNPKLPQCDGPTDPTLWLEKVNTTFKAYHTMQTNIFTGLCSHSTDKLGIIGSFKWNRKIK